MTMTNNYGTDYSSGQSNFDRDTGIRYGVIPANDLPFWYDEAESDYGAALCPECGNVAVEDVEDDSDYKPLHKHGAVADWYCTDCEVFFDSPLLR